METAVILSRYGVAAASVLLALAGLAGCGGHGDRPADVFPSPVPPAPAAVAGPDSFLLFPNPHVQPDGTLQTNTTAYASAYYRAIDPLGAKDTLDKWKAANRFDRPGGVQVSAVFGDFRDLGYGRRMTARHNTDDGTIAFVVENYLVGTTGGGGYGAGVNIDAAIVQDRQWRISVNAIEYGPGPGAGATVKYAKFYSFDPVTGERRLTQDLDGRGQKALPGVCLSCHGGRVDPLVPAGFPLLQNSEPAQRGDTRGRLHVFEVDALTFSATPGFTRADQEAVLKLMNRMVLCTYPLPAGATAHPEDLCRQRETTGNEWQGTAARLVKQGYGGDGLPAATYGPPPVPAGWTGQVDLYRNVIAPACRGCHIVRGTGRQSDIDFETFAKFDGYAERTRHLVYERGNMPLSRIGFERFWSSPMPGELAAYLDARGDRALMPARDAAGALLRPGHPYADPGPDRRVRLGDTVLSASGSLYADSFAWRIVSGPGGAVPSAEATLSGADKATPTFRAGTAATGRLYELELVAARGGVRSAPARVRLHVNAASDRDPASIDTERLRVLLGSGPGGANCVACHQPGGGPLVSFTPADDAPLHERLRGFANLADVAGSPLLRKPAGRHHNGGLVAGFAAGPPIGAAPAPSPPPGDPSREAYDEVLNWILGGARP